MATAIYKGFTESDMRELITVFIGGGLGSLLRFALARHVFPHWREMPLATFTANLIACAILGFFVGWLANRAGNHLLVKELVIIGFCGGLSTFSTFSLELVQMLQTGRFALAVGYVALSLVAGMVALQLGMMAGR